jgi:hypothetical protein
VPRTCRLGPDALEDGDAAELLAHEDARDAPHANPAEHHDDEADEAQEVLRALEVLAHPSSVER